ncbi:hypothetical protein NM208_g8262 [Fusarium decemcellulare]|uniref:Uncharacterized protein n=2 Tax=Fusarium decemcellulare TaxID=57161 RepID=A0ACC1S608_9HYPO|nr:hypothetical protein NM208_g8388 [Fusarium decemcellulare]KAJ3532824.1 hypothetical protein NM208_g8262 [Fusarium decemcellulare]
MWSLSLIVFLFLVLHAFAVEENYRYMVSPGCGEDGTQLIREWMEQVISWAQMGADVLGTDISDERIRTQFERIFRSTENVKYVKGYYQNLARFTRYERSYQEWESERNQYDVEIHCDVDRIVKNTRYPEYNTPYVDMVQEAPIEEDSDMFNFKRGLTTSVAITSSRETTDETHVWKIHSPEVITINPLRMWQYKKTRPQFNEKYIQKAAHPKMIRWVKTKVPELVFSRTWKQVDLLDTPALTLFHEMTHLMSVARSNDGSGDNADCYGWVKILANKFLGFRTADSLAYFVLLVDLIENYRYDVEESGDIYKIED